MRKLSLVIPVYNYVSGIDNTLKQVINLLSENTDIEVMFVDDGSTDGTREKIREAVRKRLALLTIASNTGKGNAVRKGALASHGANIIFTDVDLPYGLNPINQFLQVLDNGNDIVLGNREVNSWKQNYVRSLGSSAFNRLANLILYQPIPDTQCGMKGFKREAARSIFTTLSTNGYCFDVEIIKRAQRSNFKMSLVSVQQIRSGPSVFNARHAFKVAVDLLRVAII
jgi:dolichyl-phosphate beta-glucosyltransferase